MAAELHHDGELHSWRVRRHDVQEGVVCLGFHERAARRVARLEVASTRVQVILSFGPTLDIDGARHSSFVVGVSGRSARTVWEGEQSGMQLDLEPPVARALLGVPMSELASQSVVDADVVGALGGDALVERLTTAPDWPARFALIDRAVAARRAPVSREVTWALARLRASGGAVSMRSLAADLGWSPRRLVAGFRDEVGLPPKRVARIIRFERVIGLLRAGVPLADTAYSCGYADQPHLNRDFREFAQSTPADWLRCQLPGQSGTGA